MGIVAMKTMAGGGRDKSGQSTNTDAVLKWVLQNENIASIVSGMSSFEQLQKNLDMLKNLKMTEQEMNSLKLSLLGPEHSLYCHQCRQCIPQCPYNLDIPMAMRSYMYAYGYRNTVHAWHTLADAKLPGNPCENCGTCSVKCTSGFNVKNKIQDISRLMGVPKDFLLS
jgi:predicted aldo/keto reductase-like oxidoreductase